LCGAANTLKAVKHVLLLKAGNVHPPLLVTHGDYERWFQRALGDLCRLQLVQLQLNEQPPPVTGFDAVIMTGSPLSVTKPEPWMQTAAQYMLDAAAHRVSVLGVCFGHQLLAHALGVPVIRHPGGREIGSVEVQLTAEGSKDPLFEGLPQWLWVQTTHEDVVASLPVGATALAGNAHTALQAFSQGPYLRGVQFHPEIDAATMGALIRARQDKLEAESQEEPGERVPRLLAGLRGTAGTERILHNFVATF
jgi:GMP synthase (glutamine-hydrolysing)